MATTKIKKNNKVSALTESNKHVMSKKLKQLFDDAKKPEYGSCTVEQRRNGTIFITPANPKIQARPVHISERAEHPLRRWLEAMKKFTKTGEITSALVPPSAVSNNNMNKVNESVKNVLKNDKSLTEADVPFIKSFYSHLLKEADLPEELPVDDKSIPQEPKSPEDFTPDKTKGDYEDTLDPETDKEEFDFEGLDPNISTESIKRIKEWSEKLNSFAEFLNDPSTESLHKIIADGDKPGSLLRGVTRKASDSITRIAGEIEKLKEVLNGFIIMAPKRLRDQNDIKG